MSGILKVGISLSRLCGYLGNESVHKSIKWCTVRQFSTLRNVLSRQNKVQLVQFRNLTNKSKSPLEQFEKVKFAKTKGVPLKERKKNIIDRFFHWIVTENGRTWVAYLVTFNVCVSVVFCLGIEIALPHYMQERYAETIPDMKFDYADRFDNFEGNNMPAPLELVNLLAKLGQKAELSPLQHEQTSVFTSKFLDPVVIGLARTRQGCHVGVPRHLMWTSKEEVDLDSVYFKTGLNYFFKGFRIPADADPELVDRLKDALVLSPGAREFIVSYGMNRGTINYATYLCGIIPSVGMLYQYALGAAVNKKLNLFNEPRYRRLGFQATVWGIVAVTSLVTWNEIKGMANRGAIENIVRTEEDLSYAKEYYEKCLERNKLLREIIGSDSHYYIQENGELVPNFYEIPEVVEYKSSLEFLEILKERLKVDKESLSE